MTTAPPSSTFALNVLAKPWQRAGRSRSGAHYTPAETRAFEALVRDTAQLKLGPGWDLDGAYELHLVFDLPDYKTRDWDNLGKAISDALNGVAYRDDNQVVKAIVCKRYGVNDGAVTVRIDRLYDWPVKRKLPKQLRPMVDRACQSCKQVRSIRADDLSTRRTGLCKSCNGSRSRKAKTNG